VLRCCGLADGDAHRTGGAADLRLGGLEVVGVEVDHLGLGDLLDLGLGDRAGGAALARGLRALLEAGGLAEQRPCRRRLEDLRTNENERSSKIVISTGMTWPRCDSVAALYCFTNSGVDTPWGPSAVPTGGAGVAAPAGSWILTVVTTRFLAMTNLR
jgi:hypothetical protein